MGNTIEKEIVDPIDDLIDDGGHGLDGADNPLDSLDPTAQLKQMKKELRKITDGLKDVNDKLSQGLEFIIGGAGITKVIDDFDKHIIGYVENIFGQIKKKSLEAFNILLQIILILAKVWWVVIKQFKVDVIFYVIMIFYTLGYSITVANILSYVLLIFMSEQSAKKVSITIVLTLVIAIFYNIERIITSFLLLVWEVFKDIDFAKIVDKVILDNLKELMKVIDVLNIL